MVDKLHHARVLRYRPLEERKLQMAMGIGHARNQNAVVVFGLRQGIDPLALLHPFDRSVGGETHHPVAQELTVRRKEVRGRQTSGGCRNNVFHNKDIIVPGIR